MSNVENVPEDVIVDILSRLPVKSLCRFRCVSSRWRTLISVPYFVKTHLNRNLNQNSINESVFFLPGRKSLYSLGRSEESDNDLFIAMKLDYPSIGSVDILGSCNGLLLVVDKEKTKILLNLSTREFKKLPKSPSDLIFTSVSDYMYGLGYDSSSDDYKVVEVLYDCFDLFDHDDSGRSDTVVSVYSLKTSSWRRIKDVQTSSWRRIKDVPYDHWFSSEVLVNGSIHWLTRRLSAVIASLDLAIKQFLEEPEPINWDFLDKLLIYKLGFFGGCFFMLEYPRSTSTDVRVMKECWLTESWKKFTLDVPNSSVMIPMSLLVDGEVLFQAKQPYVQSLVSPNYNNGIQTKYKRSEKRKSYQLNRSNDEDQWQQPLKVYKRRGKEGSKVPLKIYKRRGKEGSKVPFKMYKRRGKEGSIAQTFR